MSLDFLKSPVFMRVCAGCANGNEATASMDAESETLVQDALSVLLKDKTVMVIAHRMRTVANADKIVVLDDGKVSEMGTPAELMAKVGLYSHLVALQQGR